MFPMDRRPTRVAVEYTARRQRVVRLFPDAASARRFYVRKFKAGAEPHIVAVGDTAAGIRGLIWPTTEDPTPPTTED